MLFRREVTLLSPKTRYSYGRALTQGTLRRLITSRGQITISWYVLHSLCVDKNKPDVIVKTDDVAWMVVFATTPATVEGYTTDDHKISFKVKAGMTKLSFPLEAGGGMKATMLRGGAIVAECNPISYRFEGRPGVYNFNVCVAMST